MGSADRDPTEAALKAEVRRKAMGHPTVAVLLGPEVIGIACEITGIDDPGCAIREIVETALDRWARLIVIERMAAKFNTHD